MSGGAVRLQRRLQRHTDWSVLSQERRNEWQTHRQ